MSGLRRRGIRLDDPLGPGNASQREEADHDPVAANPSAPIDKGQAGAKNSVTETGRRRKQEGTSWPATVRPPESAAGKHAEQDSGEVWRAWSGITGVGSFRLPHELLVELGGTVRELQLPIGMIVAAAITQLLDQPPETIAALVDKADDARIQGRRTARRRLTNPGRLIGMARSSNKPHGSTGRCPVVAAARDTSSRAGHPPRQAVVSPVNSGPAPLQRSGPDTEGGDPSMHSHRTAPCADEARVDGLIRTRYTLEVCVVCGHERLHTPLQQSSCPDCGGSARRSFALFRGLREVER